MCCGGVVTSLCGRCAVSLCRVRIVSVSCPSLSLGWGRGSVLYCSIYRRSYSLVMSERGQTGAGGAAVGRVRRRGENSDATRPAAQHSADDGRRRNSRSAGSFSPKRRDRRRWPQQPKATTDTEGDTMAHTAIDNNTQAREKKRQEGAGGRAGDRGHRAPTVEGGADNKWRMTNKSNRSRTKRSDTRKEMHR